jgi:hypothetical protein
MGVETEPWSWRDSQQAGEMLLSAGAPDCAHDESYFVADDRECGCVWKVCNACGDTVKSHTCPTHTYVD